MTMLPTIFRPTVTRKCAGAAAWLLGLMSLVIPGTGMGQTAPTNLPVIVADFNHDGLPDVLVPSNSGPTATVALGSVPFGSFSVGSKAIVFPSSCAGFFPNLSVGQILVGDFNGDGFPDIFSFCGGASTGVRLGIGDGTFGAVAPFTGVTTVSAAVSGDFNHDGKLDVALVGSPDGGQTSGILLYSGNGDGTFASPVYSVFGSSTTFPANQVVFGAAALDVNGDGYPDIVLNERLSGAVALNVFGNNQDGTFGLLAQGMRVPQTTSSLGNASTVDAFTVGSGNFYGSGKPDVFLGTSSGVLVLKNTSTATTYSFAAPSLASFPGTIGIASGSFTGSGFTDLAVANGTSIVIYASDGAGGFTTNYSSLSVTSSSGLAAAADANLDGYADLYTAVQGTSGLQLTVSMVNGTATASSQPFSLAVGSRAVSASWLGNILFTGATLNGSQTVLSAPSVTGLMSSKNPSMPGDSVTFTAGVAAAGTATTVPTGAVVFTDGTTTLGSVQLGSTGQAALTTSALNAGTHLIVATYAGDGFYAPSTSAVLSQLVSQPTQVAPTLTWAVPAAITYGTPLSGAQLNAAATNAAGGVLAGTFAYSPVAGTVLSAGLQTLRVTFTPADLTTYSVGTATVPLTVLAANATTGLALTSGGATVSSVAAGSVVTLTASVRAGTVPVTLGQVRFCDAAATYCTDIHLLGTAQLTTAGTAVLRFVPGIGAHSYKAVFVGTGNDVGSASPAAPLSVTGTFGTTTTVAQSGTAGNYGLTATVVGVNGVSGPTGTISFQDTSNGNAVLGSSALGAGTSLLSFTTASTPATGRNPINIASADLNGDGKRDLVVTNAGSNTLTILLGNGDGSFTAAASPATGQYPDYLAIGDFNGDGKPDIAVTNYLDGTVTVLLGNGDGTFAATTVNPATGVDARSIVAADFNGDGKLDLAVGRDNSVTVLLGNGDGSFTATASPATGNGPNYSIATGDFNGDGRTDLVVSNYGGNTLTVLLGNGDGTFTAAASPVTSTSPETVAVGDFNGDGKADLAVANENSAVLTVLLGNGDGTFVAAASPSSGPAGSAPQSVTVSDLNGDGKVDLIVVNQNSNGTTLLLGNGDGTFSVSAGPSVGTNPDRTAIADFNGDGVVDLAVTNVSDGTLSVLITKLTQTATTSLTGVAPAGSGAHQVIASYPGDGVYAASVSAATSLTGTTVTPVLTWSPAVSTIAYGTALGAQQLNATVASPTGAAVAGTFVYTPASGTVLTVGQQTLRVIFTPTSAVYVAVSGSVTITVTQAQPRISWSTPVSIAYGTPLSGTQLNATVAGAGSGALAGVLTYAPPAGTVLTPGAQTLTVSFAPTDTADYSAATASVPLTVTGLVLTSITPTAVPLGSPATIVTLTGSGFVANSVVQVNGTAVATTYVNGTTLTALVPATYFGQTGTLAIRVLDPSISATSAALNLTVIPMNPSITLTGPSVTSPGSQPSVTLTIVNPYPLPLTATFSLSFASLGATPVDDPAIQFAAGGRSLTIVVPANSTAVPPIQLQAGTDAGTITIPLSLTTGGINVTPTGLAPVVIVVPATVPTISTTTVTRGAGTLSVAIHGFSNTREVAMATFHFVAAPGATLSTPDITAPVSTVFGGWFGSSASVPFGSTFTYTQVFNVSDDPKNIGSVQVTLTNGVGTSALTAAQ